MNSPCFADEHALLGMILMYKGEALLSIAALRTAMRLGPHYRDAYLHIIAQAYFYSSQYEFAVSALKRRLIHKPESDASRTLPAAAYDHLGEQNNSRAVWAEMLRLNAEYSLEHKINVALSAADGFRTTAGGFA